MGLSGRTFLLACGWALTGSLQAATPAASATPGVMLLDIKGGIGPATSSYLRHGLERATHEGAQAVVLRIDTPGGLDAATRDINRMILASEVPVIAWVAPEGARAASAGTYILYASHLAAMAPATALGAATPVSMGGPGPGAAPEPGRDDDQADEKPQAQGDEQRSGAEKGSAMSRKAVNDAVAYLRSLAELRGRNAKFAEAAVAEAATLTSTQALERGVIEILSADIDDLLRQANGRQIKLRDRMVVLATAGRPITTLTPDWRSRLLSVITEPTVAYFLLLVGLYGLLFEGYSPGAVVPGVIGGICLLLALYALQVLPVNYAGVALIVLGVALIAAELAMPSFGALGIGGLAALLIGSLIMFDTDVPGFGIPGQLVAGIGVASALAFMGSMWLALRARRRPLVTGIDELLADTAIATDDFQGRGRVRIRGEIWQAQCMVPVRRGERLRVLAVEGLVLHVEPAGEPAVRSTPSEGDKP
jgi:membrane-bound serine protease (ClpP class)